MKTYSVAIVSSLSFIEWNEWEQGVSANGLRSAFKKNLLVPDFWVTELLGWAVESHSWLPLGIG